MPHIERIPCEIHVIMFPNFGAYDQERKDRLIVLIQSMALVFIGEYPNRRGIIGTVRQANTVSGFYIEEGLRQGLHGDRPENLVPSRDSNFEQIFFALFMDEGYVVLQRTSLFDYVDLSYTAMVRGFFEILGDVIRQAGQNIERIQSQKYYKLRSQEEMRTLFFTSVASEIEVTNLLGRRISDEVQLSNPDPTEEDQLRRIFEGDLTQIQEEWLRAGATGDLRRAKTAKAAIGAGEIKKVVSKLGNGEPETFLVQQDEKVNLPVNTQKRHVTPEELGTVVEIIERRIKLPAAILENRPLSEWGPLFGFLDNDKHD